MNDKKNISSNSLLLLLSGIVVILLIALNIIKINSINKASAQIESEETVLNEKKAYLEELKKLTEIRPELVKAQKILSVQIPEQPGEDQLIDYINRLSQKNKISFVHVQFEKRTINGNINEIPLQLKLTGEYTSLMDFIRSISEGERLIRIDELQIDKEDSSGSINAFITAKAFYK